jgi:hypothetical protein
MGMMGGLRLSRSTEEQVKGSGSRGRYVCKGKIRLWHQGTSMTRVWAGVTACWIYNATNIQAACPL